MLCLEAKSVVRLFIIDQLHWLFDIQTSIQVTIRCLFAFAPHYSDIVLCWLFGPFLHSGGGIIGVILLTSHCCGQQRRGQAMWPDVFVLSAIISIIVSLFIIIGTYCGRVFDIIQHINDHYFYSYFVVYKYKLWPYYYCDVMCGYMYSMWLMYGVLVLFYCIMSYSMSIINVVGNGSNVSIQCRLDSMMIIHSFWWLWFDFPFDCCVIPFVCVNIIRGIGLQYLWNIWYFVSLVLCCLHQYFC